MGRGIRDGWREGKGGNERKQMEIRGGEEERKEEEPEAEEEEIDEEFEKIWDGLTAKWTKELEEKIKKEREVIDIKRLFNDDN